MLRFPCIRTRKAIFSLTAAADGMLKRRCKLLIVIIFVCAAATHFAWAQTQPAFTNTPLPATLDEVIQARDGNFYGVTRSGDSGQLGLYRRCSLDCGTIYRITPTGTVTPIYTFTLAAEGTNGIGPSGVVQGPDGYLYGITVSGGPFLCNPGDFNNDPTCGVYFKVGLDGKDFTVLHQFNSADIGTGNAFEPLVMADDGNFYGVAYGIATGTPLSTLFRASPNGTVTKFHTLTQAEGAEAGGRMVQSTDGYLYGSSGPNYASGSAANCGSLFRLTTSGLFNIDHEFFPVNKLCTFFSFMTTLAEGPDGALYGMSAGTIASTGFLSYIFRRNPTGQVENVYTLDAATSSSTIYNQPIFGADGNLYGAIYDGGDATANAGTLFQMSPSGTFAVLHTFLAGSDGGAPFGMLLAASDGSIEGVTTNHRNGSVQGLFKSALNLPAPVQITLTTPTNSGPAETVPLNASITLNWKVLNAFSLTLQQCYAFAFGPPQTNNNPWSGKQTGTYANTVLSGSMTFIAPNVPGTYLYALTCGGVESGNATLTVGNTLHLVTTDLTKGVVSVPYSQILKATGGTQPYLWGALSKLPAGLTVDQSGGFLIGTPTQFGTYQVTVGVQDSSSTPLQASGTFPLKIDSGLQLSQALPNGVVGTAYNNTAVASGGLGPYKWALTSGKLPDGLTLNATSGVVFGTPTKAGKFSFAITLQDGEGTPAMVTQAYTVASNVPPLTIVDVTFPTCTVNVLCQGQFTAMGGTTPFTWSILSGTTFPPGLILNPNGSFSGKPLQHSFSSNPFELRVQVTDSETPPAIDLGLSSLSYLTVLTGLKIVSVPLPQATLGAPYHAPPLVASGGIPPYTWKISPLDPGVKYEFYEDPDGSLRSNGPVTPGTFALVYIVSDSENFAGTLSAGETLMVVSPTGNSSTTLSSSNATAGSRMPVTLTAEVSSAATTPTGSITFLNGAVTLGTTILDATGTASLVTSFSTVGVYTLSATYSGNAAINGSTSPSITETVVTPTVSAAFNPGTLTIASGSSGTLNITLTPTGGYSGTVTFSCGAPVPPHISCSFSPASIVIAAGGSPVTDVLTVNTAAQTTASLQGPLHDGGGGHNAILAFIFPISFLSLVGLRRKAAKVPGLLTGALLLLLTLSSVAILSGCGSSSPITPKGTYSVPVVLNLSAGPTQSLTVSITVD
jgi:uncharacterized repeat protein (TIGR03803 family)